MSVMEEQGSPEQRRQNGRKRFHTLATRVAKAEPAPGRQCGRRAAGAAA
jgi:hypothetical protein